MAKTTKEKKTKEVEPQMQPVAEQNVEPNIGKGILLLTDNIKQCMDVLIQGVEIAQKNGVYTLKDASLIAQAVDVLSPYCRETNVGNNTF